MLRHGVCGPATARALALWWLCIRDCNIEHADNKARRLKKLTAAETGVLVCHKKMLQADRMGATSHNVSSGTRHARMSPPPQHKTASLLCLSAAAWRLRCTAAPGSCRDPCQSAHHPVCHAGPQSVRPARPPCHSCQSYPSAPTPLLPARRHQPLAPCCALLPSCCPGPSQQLGPAGLGSCRAGAPAA